MSAAPRRPAAAAQSAPAETAVAAGASSPAAGQTDQLCDAEVERLFVYVVPLAIDELDRLLGSKQFDRDTLSRMMKLDRMNDEV